MALLWKFRCYVSARGVDEIRAWYDGLPPAAQAKFDSRLKFLAQRPRQDWTRPLFDMLDGECRGLGEIRFKAGNVQYRPLGYFSPGMVFTLVLCAQERGGRFDPRDACGIAQARREETLTNEERVHDCDFDLE